MLKGWLQLKNYNFCIGIWSDMILVRDSIYAFICFQQEYLQDAGLKCWRGLDDLKLKQRKNNNSINTKKKKQNSSKHTECHSVNDIRTTIT